MMGKATNQRWMGLALLLALTLLGSSGRGQEPIGMNGGGWVAAPKTGMTPDPHAPVINAVPDHGGMMQGQGPTATVIGESMPADLQYEQAQWCGPDGMPRPSRNLMKALQENACLPRIYAPNMLGDYIGTFYIGAPPPADGRILRTREERAVYKSVSRTKVADNRSPQPQTRLWASFNDFEDIHGSSADLRRATYGVEMQMLPFMSGLGSVEIYGFTNEINNAPFNLSGSTMGDLHIVGKMAIYYTQSALMSAGVSVGIPTGDRQDGIPNSFFISPFFGWIFAPQESRLFLQGFEQFDIPTHEDEQSILHSSIGIGLWLLNNDARCFLPRLASSLEFHAYNPVGSAPDGGLTGLDYRDSVNMTLGMTAYLTQNATVAVGYGIPLDEGINDYDRELHLHLNWRF